MERYVHVEPLKRLLLSVIAILFVSFASAQSPGLIIRSAVNGGDAILDPNRDGYISITPAGFTGTSDIGPSASEIPYRPLPMLTTEPLGDIKNGTPGGHTDLVAPSPLQAFYDGQNLMFRMRLGGTSTSQRGYSVLIDSDNTFGGSGANPGFEYEVVLSSGFDVKLIRHDGTSRQTLLSGSYSQFSQRAVAASTAGGDADYYIDFYVPISAFGGQITAATPLRMAGSTVNLGQSALADLTVVADVAGVNYQSYNFDALTAWRDIINTFPPTTLNDLVADEVDEIITFPPVITSPITTASTAISGTSREPAGTVVQVFRNGTSIGSTTVTADGTWTLTLATGITLAEGNQITARATATGRPVSVVSNTVVVVGEACATAAPTIGQPSPPRRGRDLVGTGIPGATIRVYRNGIQIASNNNTGVSTVTVSPNGNWTFIVCDNTGNCIPNGVYTATQQVGDGCISNPSSPIYTVNGQITAPTGQVPTIQTDPVCVSTTTLSGTAAPGAFVTLYLNGRPLNLITTSTHAYTVAAGADGTWSLTTNLGYAAGDELFARAISGTVYNGQSSPTTVVAICQSEAPVITGEYCGTTTTVTGTSTEPAGTIIRIYVDGEAVGDSALVNESGFWTVTGLEIPEGTAFTARATAPGNSESEDSAPVTATAQTTAEGLVVNSPIIEGSTTITGTGIGGATLTLYIGGTPYTPIVIPPDGVWSLSGFASTELFPGAEVTATQTVTGQCESEPAESVFVDCNPLTTTFTVTSDVSEDICGGDATVTINLANSQTGVAYSIILPDGTISGSSVMGMGDAITLVSGPIPNDTGAPQDVELRILARRVTGSLGPELPESCEAILNETVTVSVLPQPPTDYTLTPLSSNICAGSTVPVQLSPSATGFIYQFINESTNELVGEPVTGTGGPITLSTGLITGNANFGVVITNTANACVFTDAGRYTATISGPAIDRPFFTPTTAVCVGGPATIFLSTQNNPTYRYDVFRVDPNGNNVQIANDLVGNGEVLSISTGTLTIPGTYNFYAEVIGGNCLVPVRLLDEPSINVANTPGIADAGEDRTSCGSETILTAATSPDPGTGLWEIVEGPAGAIITNPTSPSSTVTGLTTGVYVFSWTVTTICGGETSETSVDTITITVNCPSTYVILPPKYRDEYELNEQLAIASDPDGGITAASLLSGSLPPGVALNPDNGDIFVENPDALVTGIYTFAVRLTDGVGATTDITLTLEILEDSPVIIPLPVELVYFTAYVRNNQAHLEWLTASEQDNDRFEIERSLDARRFEKIGTVKGKGTTSLESKYQFVDRTPVQGTVYYRLRQVDFDGEFAYSNIIAVSADGLASNLVTKVYPNPFPDVLKVTLTAPQSQAATLTVYDLNGRRVLSKEVDLEIGVNNMELQLQQLQSGMYILKIVGDGLESTTRIMKH
jgi:hypothetical protein